MAYNLCFFHLNAKMLFHKIDSSKNGQKTITITPEKKKRQLFTSFVLVVDAKTSAFHTLRMNGRNDDYTEYTFKWKNYS